MRVLSPGVGKDTVLSLVFSFAGFVAAFVLRTFATFEPWMWACAFITGMAVQTGVIHACSIFVEIIAGVDTSFCSPRGI